MLARRLCETLKKLAPGYLHIMFEYAINVTGRSSRNPYRLFAPQIILRHSLYYRGTALWNALQPSFHDTATLTEFRNSYLTF